MTSFQIGISPSRRAAGRFISRVRRALQRAVVEEGERSGLNQSKIAQAIGVHRSVISRELNGRQDITLGRIAELAWAMGREIEFNLPRMEAELGVNTPMVVPGVVRDQINLIVVQPSLASTVQIRTDWAKQLEMAG
jgi:transcriptional regulator with XRE-family HTH domain